jgi:uncharacterized protein YdeI (YjbR/CyaY-like superfamily)
MRSGATPERPRHFRTEGEFRHWLHTSHDRATELWLGLWKKKSGKGGLTYAQAVDEALCFGWIDGVRKSLGDDRYVIRFTPRKTVSKWSDVNLRRYAELEAAGRVAPPGCAAFERFDPAKHRRYSFEGRPPELSAELRRTFEHQAGAWAFFQAQPPGYRRTAVHWVMSAKRLETRERRLGQLIEVSASGLRLPQISGRATRPQ